MSIKQCLRRAGYSLVVVSALLSGCDDDSDSSTDEQSQSGDGGQDDSSGTTSTPRAGRSGGSAGRGGSGTVAGGGSGGRAASAGRGGRGGSTPTDEGGSGGRGGTGAGGTAAGGTSAGGAGGADDADAGVDTIELNDGQIAQITTVVNTGEITLGMLALNRGQVPAARDYAASMIAMHQAAQERQTALVTALGITPSPSSLSDRLAQDAMSIQNTLTTADAASFDLLYIQSQVDLHARVLNTIDEQLLPNVTAEMLRDDLVITRTEVVAHWEQAREILAALQGVDGADAGVP